MAWKNFFSSSKDNTNLPRYIETNETMQKDIRDQERQSILKSIYGKANNRDEMSTALGISSSKHTNLDSNRILRNKNILHEYSQDIIVQSIIRTRTNQVRKYARPARLSKDNVGYEIIPKKPLGENNKPSSRQKNEAEEIEEFIQNTGKKWQPQRLDFPSFISEFIYNRYVYDQINVERVFANPNDKYMHHFNFVDARNVIIKEIPKSIDQPRTFLQYPNRTNTTLGKPVVFNEKQLTFSIFNYQMDLDRHGYGYSEVESSYDHLRFHMDTEQFNARFFSQGGTTRGILVLDQQGKGGTQQTAASMSALRRQWQSQFSGINGSWKIPVIAANDAKFVNMTQTSKDMEFENWLNYLVNIICSNFQIQPDEINFPNRGGTTGKTGGSTLNEGNTQKTKMKQSMDKGLAPLFDYIEDFMNNEILRYIPNGDKYLFRFTMGDDEQALEQLKIIEQQEKNGMTIDEGRKRMNLPELGEISADNIGGIPGGSAVVVQYMQYLTNKDDLVQYMQQGQNKNDPQKANHHQPEKGMPVTAVDGNKPNNNTTITDKQEVDSNTNDGDNHTN